MKITYDSWAMKIDKVPLYYDIRATLDGIECGQVKKSWMNKWLKTLGYKFCFKDYSLTKMKPSDPIGH